MNSFFLSMWLAAAPGVDVVAVRGDARAVEWSIAAQVSQKLDASQLHALVFQDGSVMGPDFEAFTAAPVAGWPESLTPAWVSGVARCRAVAGPPPWKGRAAASKAMICGSRLAGWLWERYLGSVEARRSIVVSVSTEGATATVDLRLWEVGAPVEWVDHLTCPTKDLGAKVSARLGEVLAHQTRSERHETTTEFDAAPTAGAEGSSGELLAGPAVTTPVTLKQRCDALPGTLTFTTHGPTAESIAARWPAAAKGTGPARSCSLAMTQHEESGLMNMTVVTATLTCGQTTVSTEAAKSPPGRSGIDVLSDKVMQEFAARLCR